MLCVNAHESELLKIVSLVKYENYERDILRQKQNLNNSYFEIIVRS